MQKCENGARTAIANTPVQDVCSSSSREHAALVVAERRPNPSRLERSRARSRVYSLSVCVLWRRRAIVTTTMMMINWSEWFSGKIVVGWVLEYVDGI